MKDYSYEIYLTNMMKGCPVCGCFNDFQIIKECSVNELDVRLVRCSHCGLILPFSAIERSDDSILCSSTTYTY